MVTIEISFLFLNSFSLSLTLVIYFAQEQYTMGVENFQLIAISKEQETICTLVTFARVKRKVYKFYFKVSSRALFHFSEIIPLTD